RPRMIVRLIKIAYQALGKRGRKPVAKLCFVVRRLQRLLSPSTTALVLPVALAGWFAEAVLLSWIVATLGGTVGLLEAAFIVGVAMLAGSIPFLPGGLGGVELTLIALLGTDGVPYDVAVSATVLFRLVSFWFAIALGWACVPAALGGRWPTQPKSIII